MMGLLWLSANLLLLIQLHQSSVESLPSSSSLSGPLINVTKHLIFPDFRFNLDPNIIREVKLLGSAKFSDKNGAIQIPDESRSTDLKHQAGRAIYSFPLRLLDPFTRTPASFKTSFSFQFSSNSSTSKKIGGGSGLTFIIVPDEFTVGRPGPWLGMLNDACEDNYKAVGIEFDTRLNPDFGDPNDNHVGINLGSIISTTVINASDMGISLNDGSVRQASIVYDGYERWMDIYVDSKRIFSDSLDLSPFLNEYMFVGFSASTGNLTQIHSIFSWNFTSTSQASLRMPSMEACESKIFQQSGVEVPTSSSKKSEPSSGFLIFVAVMILALAVIISIVYTGWRRNDQIKIVVLPDQNHLPQPPNKPRRFSFAEVSTATRSFHELEILGSDSRGVYYRGKLSNGCQVAIKRFSENFLNSMSQMGLDKKRLVKEISKISRIRHPNLVPVRGWCEEKHETMVLYDLYPNGSLDKWVLGVGVLPWTRRLKVVKDVADGLSFIHSKNLSHKNMKTSSVFLDVSFRAALGDFGFLLSPAEFRLVDSSVSQNADVFEFGIFLLEVVSGRGRMEKELHNEERDLVDFAWRMHEIDEKGRVMDKRMGALVNIEQAVKVLEIGLMCTLNENKGRPSMEEVVEFLSFNKPIPELPQTRPVALFPYNSSSGGLCVGYSCTPFK